MNSKKKIISISLIPLISSIALATGPKSELKGTFVAGQTDVLNEIIAEPLDRGCNFTALYIKNVQDISEDGDLNDVTNNTVKGDQINFMDMVSKRTRFDPTGSPNAAETALTKFIKTPYDAQGKTLVVGQPYTAFYNDTGQKYQWSQTGATGIDTIEFTSGNSKFNGIRCFREGDLTFDTSYLCEISSVVANDGCVACGDVAFDGAVLCPGGGVNTSGAGTVCSPKSYFIHSTQVAQYYIYQTINGEPSPANGLSWQVRHQFQPLLMFGSSGGTGLTGNFDVFNLAGDAHVTFSDAIIDGTEHCGQFKVPVVDAGPPADGGADGDADGDAAD